MAIEETPGATAQLAAFATDLDYSAIPSHVIQRAKDCLLDSLAAGLYGYSKLWSRIVTDLAQELSGEGSSSVLGEKQKLPAPHAALANGTMIHGFELDSVRQPGAGVHPGATVVPAVLAVGEEHHANGRKILTALIAGCEVIFRIGLAIGHGVEKRGFHAPALTGTFGAAIAVGKILGLSTEETTHALGIAGSFSSGLLEFSRAKGGGMVKRLHMGRAAEGGVLAAMLASKGFTGPESVLEGKFGFCSAYSDNPELNKLTVGLGRDFETLNICIKRYPCHIYAQAPIEALTGLTQDHPFDVSEVDKIIIAGEEKLKTHHSIYEPKDVMAAQYSVPYSVSLALFFNPEDPQNFSEKNLHDAKILKMARKIDLQVDDEINQMKESRAARVVVRLKSGLELKREVLHFKGTPQNPLEPEELHSKFEILAAAILSPKKVGQIIDKVKHFEELEDVAILL
jgi:2-methylcitrate dehydratase PrpD